MNLAHGYLLTNQFEKAKTIYLENKDSQTSRWAALPKSS